MAGKFEVYKDKAGKFRFRLKAGNGQIIATGEAYESKTALMNGIESIRSNAAMAELVDMSDAPAPAAMQR
ncbi:YegP family protein [Catenulispora subtropica]|uniref:YegP family protein n=1 Tax=Catenulispora subtropica TaxID=450798 RepID=A0ABP5DQ65_9ACTN